MRLILMNGKMDGSDQVFIGGIVAKRDLFRRELWMVNVVRNANFGSLFLHTHSLSVVLERTRL
jgi:hypothetical protein